MKLYAFVVRAFITAMFLSGCAQHPAGSAMPFATQTTSATALAAASGYTQLYAFKGGSDGYWPLADLIAVNGKLYGTTEQGGRSSCYSGAGCGTVFEVGANGTHRVIHRFYGYPRDGAWPQAGFILVKGKLYGTTRRGGTTASAGTVYEIDTSGRENVVHSFVYPDDGASPTSALTEYGGDLYGTTRHGGIDACYYGPGCGVVFRVSLSGKEHVLYDFQGSFNSKDGDTPYAGLALLNGEFYGATQYGGTAQSGTVFSMSPSGKERVIHTFYGQHDGYFPATQLTSLNGELYGTTTYGGTYRAGTVFTISPAGKERVIHAFKGSPSDGAVPVSHLIVINGELYGTTRGGGSHPCGSSGAGCGTIFKMSPSGKVKVLYSFAGGKDGQFPSAGLADLNGTLYGTTAYGGAGNCAPQSYYPGGCGTIFSIKL